MATTTTNFGWDIPQSTDLVKDGATAIAALGQDIDTAFVDFKGGTTGQVLKKTSGTDLDVEWGTASSGLTLINTTSFSAVSSVSLPVDSFTSTYENYRIVYRFQQNTSTGDTTLRLRTAGVDNSAANYGYGGLKSGITSAVTRINNSSQTSYPVLTGVVSSNRAFLIFDFTNLAIAGTTVGLYNGYTPGTGDAHFLGLQHNSTTLFDSMSLITSAGTMTGNVECYGYND
jgi:hypothetical protein